METLKPPPPATPRPKNTPRPPANPFPNRKRNKGRAALLSMATIVVLLIVATGVVVLTAGEVPRGTTVLGVDIGGMTKSAAASKLRTALRGTTSQPVSLKFEGKTFSAVPADIGLSVDVEATAARAADRAVNPIAVLSGSTKVDPVIKVDKTLLRAGTLDDTAADSTEMVRPAITYEGLTPKPLYGKQGSGIDIPKAISVLRAGWLRSGTIVLPKGRVLPETSDAELNGLLRAVAAPAVSGPVKVELPQKSFDITPQQIAGSLTFLSDEQGAVHPKVDPKKLATVLDGQLRSIGKPAEDATVKVVNGALKTTPSQAGVGVNTDTLAQDLLPVLQAQGPARKVKAALGPLQPKLSSEQLAGYGIKEKISTFTTNFNGGEDRNRNILVVADKVDNAIVKPGDTFALNKFTGERGVAQGYVMAPVILDGKLKNQVGGGISQFATTLYNAVFFSGLQDVFHKAHSYYFSRYPAGREATVFYPGLDISFKNDSKYGVLIDTSHTSNSITVSFYSTKRYDIESVSGERTNPKPVQTQYLEEEGCIATQGIPGFDIVVWRVFKQGGREIKRERIFTRYKAEPKFVCGKDPNKAATPGSG